MSFRLKNFFIQFIAAVMLVSATCSIAAQEYKPSLSFGLGVQHSDNVSRREFDTKADTKLSLTGAAGYQSVENWYQLYLNYSASQNNYIDNSYQEQRLVNGRSRLVLGQPGHWFSWFFSNSEQTTVVNVLNPDTPDNRSQRSVYETGPQLNFNISHVDQLRANYTLAKVNVDSSSADSESDTSSIGYSHRFSETFSGTLNYSRVQVRPNVDTLSFLAGDNEYLQKRSSISLQKAIKNGSLSFTYGVSELDGIKGISSSSNEEYSVAAKRSFGIGELDLSYGKSISNSGSGGLNALSANLLGATSFDVQENKRTQLSYKSPTLPGRVVVWLTTSRSQLDVLTRDLFERRQDTQLRVTHNTSAKTQLFISGQYQKNEINESGRADRREYSIGANYKFSKQFNFDCSVKNEIGSGDRKYDSLIMGCNANWRVY